MTDTISRQAAIAAIMEYFPSDTINHPKYHAGKSLVQALTALPAVGGWLDIESAPECWMEEREVLLYLRGGGCAVTFHRMNDGTFWAHDWEYKLDATHWQHLPAPPNP